MTKKLYLILVAGLLVGSLTVFALRAALYKPASVHYHANFGLFIDGKQDKFESFTQYEEVQACRGDNLNDPKEHAHMHQPNNHVVHVHANAVTWSDFFTSIGYGLSDKAVTTTDRVYVNGQDDKKLTFTLNGEVTSTISEKVINDKDMLLISYGLSDSVATKTQYDSVPKDADVVDKTTDPASCGGAEKTSFGSRFKHAFNMTN